MAGSDSGEAARLRPLGPLQMTIDGTPVPLAPLPAAVPAYKVTSNASPQESTP